MGAGQPAMMERVHNQMLCFQRRYPCRFLAFVAIFLLLASCSRAPEFQSQQFVGVWKSSRLASRPLHLLANGEWEIRSDSAVKPLQYGVWAVQGSVFVWTVRSDGQIMHDRNRIESYEPRRFVLRENDGSLTHFDRLD
jgi:hypothetical protein